MLLVIENVLKQEEVAQFRRRLDAADWIDGRATAGTLSHEVKRNRQLAENSDVAVSLGNHLLRTLGNHPQFVSAALPERIYQPKFNRYAGGERYGAHVDGAIMRVPGANLTIRTDVSATLFLCEPDEYDGGVLTIEGTYGAQEVKLPAGDLVLYPSHSLHEVTPVTRGERTCAFFWLQSMVADAVRRGLLYDLDQTIQALRARGAASPEELLRLTGIYSNLLRQWAVV